MPKSSKKVDPKSVAISIRIPEDLLDKMKKKSKQTGVPYSFVARRAFEEWVKKRDMFVLYDPTDTTDESGT